MKEKEREVGRTWGWRPYCLDGPKSAEKDSLLRNAVSQSSMHERYDDGCGGGEEGGGKGGKEGGRRRDQRCECLRGEEERGA